jgi:hypothetical protein
MQVSGTGAVVGSLVGAAGRAFVLLGWIAVSVGYVEGSMFIAALPSAGIGLLVGAIAGALGKPLRGAVVGFVLSAFVFELFMCACASALPTGGILGQPNAGWDFLLRALPYMLLMGLAGAAAGGIGGAVGIAAQKNGKTAAGSEPGADGAAEPDATAERPSDEGFFKP